MSHLRSEIQRIHYLTLKRWENTTVHPLVVGDAEPLLWPTPNNGGGDGGGGEIQGCCLFERVQLLLVMLNPCLGQHRTTAAVMVAGNCITTPTGLNNNSHRCKPMVRWQPMVGCAFVLQPQRG